MNFTTIEYSYFIIGKIAGNMCSLPTE